MRTKQLRWTIFFPMALQACGVIGAGGDRNAKESALNSPVKVYEFTKQTSLGKTNLLIYTGELNKDGLQEIGNARVVIEQTDWVKSEPPYIREVQKIYSDSAKIYLSDLNPGEATFVATLPDKIAKMIQQRVLKEEVFSGPFAIEMRCPRIRIDFGNQNGASYLSCNVDTDSCDPLAPGAPRMSPKYILEHYEFAKCDEALKKAYIYNNYRNSLEVSGIELKVDPLRKKVALARKNAQGDLQVMNAEIAENLLEFTY